MAEVSPQEGLLTANRISELREHPVQGKYDAAHLQEIHRHIFQDLPHHHPGEYRPDSSLHRKSRELEGAGTRYIVDYAGSGVQQRVETILEDIQGGEALQGLDQEEFSQRMAQLYGDLDHAHPFREGNSRTLREFTHQLAQDAGYQLDWHSTNADAETRNRLYVARDVAVYERQYPGLNDQYLQENSHHPRFADLHHANHMLKVFHDSDRLETVIQQASVPVQFQVQQPELLNLDRPVFAQQAAQRLAETVRGQELTPAQVRQEAAALGQEAQRSLNLSVMTDERVRQDTQNARLGQVQGFERMFQEASDPASAKLMQKAIENLEQRDVDPSRLYVTVAEPGQQHAGQLEFKTSRVAVVGDEQGRHLVTPSQSLKGMSEGPVTFTAQEPMTTQQQLDYD